MLVNVIKASVRYRYYTTSYEMVPGYPGKPDDTHGCNGSISVGFDLPAGKFQKKCLSYKITFLNSGGWLSANKPPKNHNLVIIRRLSLLQYEQLDSVAVYITYNLNSNIVPFR